MQKIKVLAALGAALLAGSMISTAALADGMPAKRAKAEKAERMEAEERPHIGNWSGLYFGVNVGYAWSDSDWNFTHPELIASGASPTSFSTDNDNGILGGHVGIQHQWGRFVVGVEASWSGVGVFGDSNGSKTCLVAPAVDPHCETKRIDSLFLVGPRLGITHDRFLGYITGGYASARIDSRLVDPDGSVTGTAGTVFAPVSKRHDGWFLGAGVETMLHDRWVLGIEYIHVDLDRDLHHSASDSDGFFARDIDGNIDIVRARLSFKLGRHEERAEPMK